MTQCYCAGTTVPHRNGVLAFSVLNHMDEMLVVCEFFGETTLQRGLINI